MTHGLTALLSAALTGRYVLERELAGGGMSRVFLARELALGRTVVLKVLPADTAFGVSAERFAREIEQKDALVEAGMAPALLEELERMVSEFETASEEARATRQGHIQARLPLEEGRGRPPGTSSPRRRGPTGRRRRTRR